jgi:short subunit dehydrogenase-like uncharacterized protein
MNNKAFLILGGYGNTGKLVAQLLLQETDVRLVLAGRSMDKANAAAATLNRSFPGNRVSGVYADAADPASLQYSLKDIDLIVVASSTAQYAKEVAAAALATGVDYLDVQYSTKKVAVLKSMQAEIEKSGCCFITDGGFHPGVPAALMRFAGLHFDRLEKANVGSVIKQDWAGLNVADATLVELVEEINDFVAMIYKDGQWTKLKLGGMADYKTMDFGREFGKQYCVPMFLEELRPLPQAYPGLRECGFFVGGFNWFVDWLVMPVAIAGMKLWPRGSAKPMGKLMKWGLNAFSKPPYGTMLKLEGQGEKDGEAKTLEIRMYHPDGYMFTAIPVVACLLQYLDDSIKQPGLWTQANIVKPERFMKDIERMGVQIQMNAQGGKSA